jgi:hypothetical protein
MIAVGSSRPNFSLGPNVSFRGEAEVGRAAEPAASVESDPQRNVEPDGSVSINASIDVQAPVLTLR